ncbi:alpha/beta-hydrolase [Hysterangium stoloniferum]|nr:alpha/beta-hydrolase [Hysterangium stoloniferum]
MADKLPSYVLSCNYREEPTPVALDLYLPPLEQERSTTPIFRPTIVYFHGGGLTVGDRTSWFPTWVHARAMAAGYAFVTADYQLLPPATGHEIVEDIKALFSFIGNKINDVINSHGRYDGIDPEKLSAVGNSAGGLCAYLAGIHAYPKPKSLISIYGMGGNFVSPHYLTPKYSPFFLGRELLDKSDFPNFIYPQSLDLPPTTSSKPTYHGPDYHIPGYPSNPRMFVARLFLQLGNYLDYYTGIHNPSFSDQLRPRMSDKPQSLQPPPVPANDCQLFPQFNISALPPIFFIHGSDDTAVPAKESQSLYDQLHVFGTSAVLKICAGMEHSFDYQPDAEKLWGDIFDEAFTFLGGHLK